MAKQYFAIVLPVVNAGVGNLVDVAGPNQHPDAWGIFTFNNAKSLVTRCVTTQPTYSEALLTAKKCAQEVITAFEVVPVELKGVQKVTSRAAKFFSVYAVNTDGESFWLEDCWNKESAINLACAYGQTIMVKDKAADKEAKIQKAA